MSLLLLRRVSLKLDAKLDAHVFVSNAEGVEYELTWLTKKVKVIVPQYGYTQSIIFINRRVMNIYSTWMLIKNASRGYFPVDMYGWT